MTEARVQIVLDAKDKTGPAFKSTSSKMQKLNRTADKLSKALGIGIVAGFAGLVSISRKSIKAFEAQEMATSRLTSALLNVEGQTQQNVDALKEYAQQLQRTTTFGDEEIISAQGMLATFQLNEQQIRKLTPRLLDMAASLEKTSGQTVDLEQVSIAMGKVIGPGGTAGALKRYGVAMSEAQEEQFNLATGMERVNLLAEILDGNFQGIAEASAQTLTGQIRQMQNAMGDLQEVFAEGLLKGLQPFVVQLKAFAEDKQAQETVKQLGESLGILAGDILPQVIEGFRIMKTVAEPVLNVMIGIGDAILFATEKLETLKITIERFVSTNALAKFTSGILFKGIGSFTPQQRIAPGPQSLVPRAVAINITGNTITGDAGIEDLADRVGREVMRVLKTNQNI